MVRVISQETFDSVVKENMEEFDMTKEEAIQEAQEQFRSQGVDLSNIVIGGQDGDHVVVKAIEGLNLNENLVENCCVIRSECSKGLAEKVLATQSKGYEALVKVALDNKESFPVRSTATQALSSLLDGNPDPLDEQGFLVVVQGLNTPSEKVLVEASLDMALSCCVRHEQNRQNLVKNGLLDCLDGVVDNHPVMVARLWQALVQDDDVRVPFGKAHEHARMIVEDHDGLFKLIDAVNGTRRKSDLALLLGCLSSLSVRNEYCQHVVDKGGLQCILDLLVDPDQSVGVVRQSLVLIKTLAGNDNVKKDIRATQGVGIIVNSMSKHVNSRAISHAGCGAITSICLRTPENAQQVMEAGGCQVLVEILKTHMATANVLISCAEAIRNIVSRSRHYCAEFEKADVETILNEVASKHPEAEDSVKAALRDLNLKVQLKEEWKGAPKTTAISHATE